MRFGPFSYRYEATIGPPPADGELRFDTSNPASATACYMAAVTGAGADASLVFLALPTDRSGLHLEDQTNSANTFDATIDGAAIPSDDGTYFELPLLDVVKTGPWGADTELDTYLDVTERTYATIDDLAAALHIRVSAENTPALQRALYAAASEIDQDLDRVVGLPDPAPSAIVQTNIDRGVEWYKAADAAYGIVGVEETGAIRAPKDGFSRHSQNISRYKQRWGLA